MTAMEIRVAGGVPATSPAMAASAAWGQTAKLLNPKELQQLWFKFTLACPGPPAGLLMEHVLRDRDSRPGVGLGDNPIAPVFKLNQ